MAQHLMEDTQIGPAGQKVRGKGVPDAVRRDFAGDTRFCCVFLDLVPELHPAGRLAELAYKKRFSVGVLFVPELNIFFNAKNRPFTYWDNTLFPALADYPHITYLKVQVALFQAYKFRYSKACGVKQFKHRFVPYVALVLVR